MKRFRNLKQSQRGGVAIAVVLMMAFVIIVGYVENILLRGYTLTAEETDRMHETISIQQIYVNNSSNLVLSVKNTGGVNSRLVAVWVEPTASPNEAQRVTIDEYVSVEEVKTIVLDASILNASMITDVHMFTVVTERGNLAAAEYPVEEEQYIPKVEYLGIFGIDWFHNKYSSLQNPPNGSELSEAAYISKSEDYIAFYMNVTNSYNKSVAIRKESFLALTTIVPPQGAGVPNFFLVKNVSYGASSATITAYDDSNPYVVFPNASQILIFAAKASGAINWRWGWGYPFGSETTTDGSDIQVSLFYELLDDDLNPTGKVYGQAISTHAITLVAK